MKLTNQEIWLAYPNLVKLGGGQLGEVKYPGYPLPVKASLGIAIIMSDLQRPYLVVELVRAKVVKKYGVMDEKKTKITVPPNGENAGAFAIELSELWMTEWPHDIEVVKVTIPQKMTGKCEHCGQPMDIVVLIEPQILIPLAEHFVEVI